MFLCIIYKFVKIIYEKNVTDKLDSRDETGRIKFQSRNSNGLNIIRYK
jgi:hypothetical protein